MEVRCYSPARIRHVPGSLSDSFAAPERDVCAAALRRSPTGRRILVGSESPGPDNLADSSGHRSAARKADAETATRDSGRLKRTEWAVFRSAGYKGALGSEDVNNLP